jgi:hypothetical protein
MDAIRFTWAFDEVEEAGMFCQELQSEMANI